MGLHGWRKAYKNCLVLPISTRCIFFLIAYSIRTLQLSVLDLRQSRMLQWYIQRHLSFFHPLDKHIIFPFICNLNSNGKWIVFFAQPMPMMLLMHLGINPESLLWEKSNCINNEVLHSFGGMLSLNWLDLNIITSILCDIFTDTVAEKLFSPI